MFFKSKNNKNEPSATPAATPAKILSFITKDSTFEGIINTEDSIEISGEFVGNIDSKKEVIIGKYGLVTGTIKADRIVSKGTISGKSICNTFKGDIESFTKDSIEAISVTIMGEFEGTINCDELHIQEEGFVKTIVQAKSIEISGKIEGDIACESLSTTMQAKVKGNLFVNKLLNDGGSIDGNISKYKDILTPKEEKPKEVSAPKSPNKEKELVEN